MYYWTAVTLGPLVLFTAVTMTGSLEFSQVIDRLVAVPWLERFLFKAISYIILWIGFGSLYGLMPNTRVHWWAATIGGIVAGTLWRLNACSARCTSPALSPRVRFAVASASSPILLIGIYFSWYIVLFGAQVSFVGQNHRASERLVCRQFLHSQPALSVGEISRRLNVPTSLINRLARAGPLAETTSDSSGVIPALRTNGVGGTKRDADIVESVLGDLRAAERSAPADLRFSDLAEKT